MSKLSDATTQVSIRLPADVVDGIERYRADFDELGLDLTTSRAAVALLRQAIRAWDKASDRGSIWTVDV